MSSSGAQLCNASDSEEKCSQPAKTDCVLLNTTLRLFGNAPLGSDRKVFRPMMMVWPVVSALKRFRSLGNQYISLF